MRSNTLSCSHLPGCGTRVSAVDVNVVVQQLGRLGKHYRRRESCLGQQVDLFGAEELQQIIGSVVPYSMRHHSC